MTGKEKFELALRQLPITNFFEIFSVVSEKKLANKLTTSAECVYFTRTVQIAHKGKSIFLTTECYSQVFQKTRKMRFEASNNITYTVSQFVRHGKQLH